MSSCWATVYCRARQRIKICQKLSNKDSWNYAFENKNFSLKGRLLNASLAQSTDYTKVYVNDIWHITYDLWILFSICFCTAVSWPQMVSLSRNIFYNFNFIIIDTSILKKCILHLW